MEISSLISLKKIISLENFTKKISNLDFVYHRLDKINQQFFSKKKFKLSDSSQIEFIQNYYNFISGVINIDNKIEKNFEKFDEENLFDLKIINKIDKYDFNAYNNNDNNEINEDLKIFNEKNSNRKNFLEKNFLKKSIVDAYFKNFGKYKNSISPIGTNFNDFIKYFYMDFSGFGFSNENFNFDFLKKNIFFSDLSEYHHFRYFVSDLIMNYQDFNVEELDHIHKADEFKSLPSLVDSEKKVKNFRISCFRNLPDFIFGLNNNLFNSADKVKEIILENFEKEKIFGFKFIEISSEEFIIIKQENKINLFVPEDFNSINTLNNNNEKEKIINFSDKRGLLKLEKEGNFYIIINDIEHLRFECFEDANNSDINKCFMDMMSTITILEKNLKFSYSKKLGYITSNPNLLGTGLIFEVYINLKNLFNDKEKLQSFFKDNTFTFDVISEDESLIKVINHATIGFSENDILRNLIILINELIDNDK
jgi:protein-arginine kinase